MNYGVIGLDCAKDGSYMALVLQGCAYRLASESMGEEDGEAVPFVEEVPERPNPVTQDEMDAGSVELF